MDSNAYNKEYREYFEYALQRFLIEQRSYSEYDAQIRVMQEFEVVEQEAREAGFL
jgi:hypothetical protein